MELEPEKLRAKLMALPGTQEQKAREMGVQLSWLSKFLRGKIHEPRLSRISIVRDYVSRRTRALGKAT